VYWVVIVLIVAVLISLPFIKVTIAVTSKGIVRPVSERTEVKNLLSGVIEKIYCKEGDTIRQGDIILRIRDQVTAPKLKLNNYELDQRKSFLHDLHILTTSHLDDRVMSQLVTPLFKEELNQYLVATQQQQADLRKATKELQMNKQLVDEKVIAPKEFFDTQVAYDKAVAQARSLERTQLANWQQDLAKYSIESSQFQQELSQVHSDATFYDVKAPVSGTVQNINTLYAGGILQAGATVCNISPNDSLIGECYVSTKDIGLIKRQQPVIFQIDAFDYNYFGTLNGVVVSINNDYTVQQQGQTPAFIVRCAFASTKFKLKNGYQNTLNKGLTFQSRFIIGKRTLWQLLWDKMDNWLNPSANTVTIN